jgi:hypothetical protein
VGFGVSGFVRALVDVAFLPALASRLAYFSYAPLLPADALALIVGSPLHGRILARAAHLALLGYALPLIAGALSLPADSGFLARTSVRAALLSAGAVPLTPRRSPCTRPSRGPLLRTRIYEPTLVKCR